MTHWFEYSIGAVHMQNAKDCVGKMLDVIYKEEGFIYGEKENEIFFDNTRYGVLAIYSINASLETVVAITSRELQIKEKSFKDRIDILIKREIITKKVTFQRLNLLRKKRNLITHWEQVHIELLGTDSYLPVMFTKISPKNKIEELISILTLNRMSQYIDDLLDLLNDIVSNIDREKYGGLYDSLKQIIDRDFVVGY
ncbi:hypothetical protein [Cytobacillus kochii]|uniref:hypothetical protein n=1 Tax=Cytobacillus kochii TaxID=859143 RepID=UPI00203CA8F4|nr:hypothetical protein [Cytobacillus kochii]MCM3324065.1 hypothetical protein [Cytobacillus kochii]MCM3346531.1 hypothetical protein [Cytobacillus kochii]